MYCVCVCTVLVTEARGGRVVEALRYKPEAAGSIPDGAPSGRTIALESTQTLTEMSTMLSNGGWGVKTAGV